MRLTPATTWGECNEALGVCPRRATRPTDRRECRNGDDLDGRPRRRWNDVRGLTRRGQEGPGRAEGRESGRCRLQDEGGGRGLRPRPGHRRPDDRRRGAPWLPREAEAAVGPAPDPGTPTARRSTG